MDIININIKLLNNFNLFNINNYLSESHILQTIVIRVLFSL